MGWIGDSMGWKSKSMGWIDESAAWTHENNAKRRTGVGVRFNGLTYSAQLCARAVRGVGQKGKSRGSRATMAAPMSSWSGRPTFR